MRKTPLIFFGAGGYISCILTFLYKAYDLRLVVTTQAKTDGVPAYCEEKRIPYLCVSTLRDPEIQKKLIGIGAPVAVLAYFGLIVPQRIIDIFPKGIINIHPSLLPKYRGPTPGQSAIRNADSVSGVSIMLLDKYIDHGPLLAQEKTVILPYETAQSFYEKAFLQGTDLLEKVLPGYLNGTLSPKAQDDKKATFTANLTKLDGFLDTFAPLDKQLVTRMIRAYYPWPGVWTLFTLLHTPLTNKVIKFLPDASEVLIQVEGKKPMGKKDFLNGYPFAKEWLEKII